MDTYSNSPGYVPRTTDDSIETEFRIQLRTDELPPDTALQANIHHNLGQFLLSLLRERSDAFEFIHAI